MIIRRLRLISSPTSKLMCSACYLLYLSVFIYHSCFRIMEWSTLDFEKLGISYHKECVRCYELGYAFDSFKQ